MTLQIVKMCLSQRKERETNRPEGEIQSLVSALSLTWHEPPTLSCPIFLICQVRIFILIIAKVHLLLYPCRSGCNTHTIIIQMNSCTCLTLFTIHEISPSIISPESQSQTCEVTGENALPLL